MTSLDPRDLRRAFGSFMTGVTVVTTRDTSGTPLGFTANSFSSVSLDPPLLLVCPGKNLSSYDAFASCEYFAVNILAEGQEDVSNTFAGFKGDRFAKTAHQLDANGVPLLDGAVATFSCRAHQAIDAGDHCILIGEVGAYSYAETRGLGYANGQYFSLGLERGAFEAADRSVVCGAIIECNGKVLLEKTASGYRPPQISLSDHQALRESLQQDLATRGITAQLGAVYSVYDDATTHHVYTLASVPALPLNSTLEAVAIKQLTDLTFATPAIATMMSRFAFESLTRDFSLYLGDAQRGDVHTLSERTE